MKRFICYIIFCILVPMALQAEGKAYTINDVPNVRHTNKSYYVSDPEHILSQETVNSINSMLYQLEIKTGVQTAVVVLPSIGDEDPFDFAYSLGRRWGVGKRAKILDWYYCSYSTSAKYNLPLAMAWKEI